MAYTTAKYSFTIAAGATFRREITYPRTGPVMDLSGYTAVMKARSQKESATVLLELTDGAGITLAATAPNIIIHISPADTSAIDMDDMETAVYDLKVLSGGEGPRVMEGTITYSKEVSY